MIYHLIGDSMELYRQIYNHLMKRINLGEFDNEKLLPTEKALQETFNVSRITVKKAYDMLLSEGLIKRVAGKGTMLTDKKSKEKSKGLVGVVLCSFNSSFGGELIKSIEKHARLHNLNIVLKLSYDDIQNERNIINELIDIGVIGIIIQNCHHNYTDNLISLIINDFPIISVDRYAKELLIPSVTSDNFNAAYNAAKRLIVNGHKKILLVSGKPENTSTLSDRVNGFIAACKENDCCNDGKYLITDLNSPFTNAENDIKNDGEKIKKLILSESITAIVATERFAAELCDKVLNELGMKMPFDCEMICFDYGDLFFGKNNYTHIKQNELEMGKVCVEQLMKRINRESFSMRSTVVSRLVQGKTTKN